MAKNGHLLSQIFWGYQRHARERGISFELSKLEFEELTKQNCYICGEPPSNTKRSGQTAAVLRYNGVDRVDNSLGYMAGNVMPCCRVCNSIKGKLSLAELRAHIERMLKGLEGV